MKIIFLDIDGVLNSMSYDRKRTVEQGNIDETRLPLLKQIIVATDANVVLSSSWRKHWDKDSALCDDIGFEINQLFAKYSINIFDKTPYTPDKDRAEEIRSWLRENDLPQKFVILDDVGFGWGTDLQDHLVRTDCRIGRGLENKHVQMAIELLNSEMC